MDGFPLKIIPTCWLPHWCHHPSWGCRARGWWRCHYQGSSRGPSSSQLFCPGQGSHSAPPPPIRRQNWGHLICVNQSEGSIFVFIPGSHSLHWIAEDWIWAQPLVLSIGGQRRGQQQAGVAGPPLKHCQLSQWSKVEDRIFIHIQMAQKHCNRVYFNYIFKVIFGD